MRVRFTDVFQQNPDGSCTPRVQVTIHGVTVGPFSPGAFSGLDIAKYAGKDLEVEIHSDGRVEVKGAY